MKKRFLFSLLFCLAATMLPAQIAIGGHVYAGTESEDIVPVPDWPLEIIGPDSVSLAVITTDEEGAYLWIDLDAVLVPGDIWGVNTLDPCFFGVIHDPFVIIEDSIAYQIDISICNESNPPTNDVCEAFFGSDQLFDSYDVQFYNLSSVSQDVTVYWDFGDGFFSSQPDPVHTYAEAGEYNVSLTITGDSCSSTSTQVVTVVPVCNCDQVPSDPVCYIFPLTGEVLSFNNSCEAICLGIDEADLFTCDPNANCVVYIQYSAFPGELEYDFTFGTWFEEPVDSVLWDFGDGTSTNVFSPTHTFPGQGSYEVTLTAYAYQIGCVSTQTITIVIEGEPNYDDYLCQAFYFFFQPDMEDMLTFQFFALEFYPGAEYSWDFGDGNTAEGTYPTHTYSEAGNYLAALTITGPDSCESTFTVLIEVSDNIWYGSEECRAWFLPYTDETFEENTVAFINASSPDAEAFLWDFGDGNSSTDSSTVHTYDEPGIYIATLTAFSSEGCENSMSVIINLLDNSFTTQPSYSLLSSNLEQQKSDLSVSVSPNPSQGLFQITVANEIAMTNTNWTISDLNGRPVKSGQQASGNQLNLDINEQPAGIYLLRLESQEGVAIKRLIKQ